MDSWTAVDTYPCARSWVTSSSILASRWSQVLPDSVERVYVTSKSASYIAELAHQHSQPPGGSNGLDIPVATLQGTGRQQQQQRRQGCQCSGTPKVGEPHILSYRGTLCYLDSGLW